MQDASLNIKLISSIYKFYTEKQGELPLYFGNDVSEFKPAYVGSDLIKSRKHIEKGILDTLVEEFFSNPDISLSGFGMLYNGELVKEYYKTPYSFDYRRVSYSVCKTVISLALGIAIDKGYITLDTKVSTLFPEHNKIFMKRDMKQLSVRHLLTMTAGVYFDEIRAFFSFDWRKDFMGSENLFPPGKEFYYNSLNSYMLGACISKATGKNLMDFLEENLFIPMNMRDITWDKCPMGLPKGGWGMKLSLRDMLKIGKLIQNNGTWTISGKETQLVSKEYIRDMTKKQVDIKDKRLITGYGYGVWILKDNSILLNGIFGQNVYINNEKKIVIATCGSAKELFPEGKLVENIINFAKKDLFKKDKINWHKGLYSVEGRSIMLKRLKLLNLKRKLAPYLGNEYRFKEYASSLLPLMSQVMYSNFLTGIDMISFDISEDIFYMRLSDSGFTFKIRLGYHNETSYDYQIITINGKEMPIATFAKIIYDEEKRMLLKIHIVFLEEVSHKVFKIYFNEDNIKFSSAETPDLLEFMNKFVDDDLLLKIKKYKKIGSMDYILYKTRNILHPKVIGYIDD